jgi:hypothetical protein
VSESCPVAHNPNSTTPFSRERPVMGSSGRVCVVVPKRSDGRPQVGGGSRGEVRDWSPGSRRRLLFGLGTLDFERERGRKGKWVSLTLTYGADPGPARFRRDRDAWLAALRKDWRIRKMVWKVEFHQHWRGGVPHLHMMVLMSGASESTLREFRRWGWDRWEKIAGDRYRFDARWATARVMATYVATDYTMNGRKAAQQRVPDGWGHVGRWWAINGMKARWVTRPLTFREFRVAKALVRHQYAVESSRCVPTDNNGSAWVLTDHGSGFAEAVYGFLQSLPA